MDFDQRIRAMDKKLLRHLNDGVASFYDKTGALLAENIKVMLDRDVQHPAEFIERITTITIRIADLPNFDRQGHIEHKGIGWRIDGIASDDGYLLTLKVLRK